MRRWPAIVALVVALGACAMRERQVSHEDPNTYSRDSSGKSIPTEVYEGTIGNLNYKAGQPHILVKGKDGGEQWMDITQPDSVHCKAGSGTFPCNPTQDFARQFDWFVGDKVSGFLLQEDVNGVATWLVADMQIVLTPPQEAVLAQMRAEQAARLAEVHKRDEARRAAAESERLKKVAQWRALMVKPPLPAEANRNRVLAENAVQEKRFDDAARYYEAALQAEPLWPDGQYNAALVQGELHNYRAAAEHGHRYLELAPNADDAQAIGDKVIIWEEKAKAGGGK